VSAITTLAGFYTEVTRVLDGEDPTVSDMSYDSLARFTLVAQRRIYREIRTRYNELAFSSVTVTSNAATLPSDFEDASIVHFGKKPLEPISEERLRQYIDNGGTGNARFFAKAGSSLMFFPAVSDTTVVQGRYWARLSDLTDANIATNALFQAADDLFIYATLVECAPYFKPQMFQVWESKYVSIREALNANDAHGAYSAGRMKVRPSTSVIR
jgi:hypothetical protein